jgi:hypothetical protein
MDLVELSKAVKVKKRCSMCKAQCDRTGFCVNCGHDNGSD